MLSNPATMLAAAAALVALAVAPAVSSAPPAAQTRTAADGVWRPGADGVDLAAVTGPKGSQTGRLPACADPARRGDLRPC